MSQLRLKIGLIYNFAIPALLLNCIGIIILNLANYNHVSMNSLSWLESFKDFSILIASFLLASYIPKMGYKKSLLVGTLLETVACLFMALSPSYLTARFFFILIGISFALIKVATYSSVGLITTNDKDHASFVSILEGFFMVGVLSGFWIFGLFMKNWGWIPVFWFLATLSFLGFLLFSTVTLDESTIQLAQSNTNTQQAYLNMFRLLKQIAVISFIILAVCYLFIEQGIINWLPTFNNHVLHIASSASVEIASLLSAGFALGRLFFGMLMRRIHWRKILIFCMLSAIAVLLFSIYLTLQLPPTTQVMTHWSQFPMVAYILPLVGFLVAPIYPTLCSSILSRQPKELHSAMTVWIMIFSAIGGAIGARVLGELFSVFGGLTAIGILIVPLGILLIFVLPYAYQLKTALVATEV